MTLPPGPRAPYALQSAAFLLAERRLMQSCRRRHGDVFTLRIPTLDPLVVIADPALVKQVFSGDPATLHAGEGNAILEPIVGPTSVLLLDEERHLRQRRLMLPPFHGERMRSYGELIAEIAGRELDRWPLGTPFSLHEPMQEITLEVILRAVFGIEDGERLADLTALLGRMLDLGQRVTMVPLLRRDLGPLSPWRRFVRSRELVDAVLYDEIRRRRADPATPERADVLSMLLQARDEDGEGMTDAELRDELLTLLVAGHETTATALAWAFERLLRHPATLARVHAELDDDELLDAVVRETLRVRPVLSFAMRRVKTPYRLGEWELPPGATIGCSIPLVHERADLYPDPLAFRPERFLEQAPETYGWIPFGGGVRRCLGAAFAAYEMRIILRTILARAELSAPDPRPERRRRRAITFVPGRGTRVVLQRRSPAPAPRESADAAVTA
jgi:cytochrome P450